MAQTVVETAWASAPMMNRQDARRRTGLRPRRSARNPVTGEAKRAKREVEEVIRDLERVERGAFERSLWMETRVDDITPVLQRYQYLWSGA